MRHHGETAPTAAGAIAPAAGTPPAPSDWATLHRLLPYLYSLFYEASKTGIPINRSLAINYTFDGLVYDHRYHNQYLFGPSILVAPVESTKDLLKVYLPEGDWYDLFTDQHHAGNREIVADCPMEQLPVYVKGSAIIPMRERAGINTRDQGEVLEIHLYKGSIANSFTFYEDDGSSFDHEKGAYAKRMIAYHPGTQSLTFDKTEGAYSSLFKKLKLCLHGFEGVDSVKIAGTSMKLEAGEYRFVQPISNYDPVGTMPEGLKINSLKFIVTDYTSGQLVIRW